MTDDTAHTDTPRATTPPEPEPATSRTHSQALQRLIDELTAERYRPVPPPPHAAPDAQRAREELAEALRPMRRTPRDRP
jgi:hypothetical protein